MIRHWLPRRAKPRSPSACLVLESLETRTLPAVVFTPGPLLAPAGSRPDIALGVFDGSAVIEPILSVNPTDPGNLAVSSQGGLEVTSNAGGTAPNSFTANTNFPLPPGADFSDGDTATAYDAQGRLFWANLAHFTAMGDVNYIAVAQINPTTGTQIGTTATVPHVPDRNADKEFLAADSNPQSPFANNLYVSFDLYNPTTDEFEVFFSRSTDQGQTWSTPVQLSVNSGPNSEGFTWPSTVSVASNGDVYVAYHAQPDLTDSDVELSPGNNPDGSHGGVIVFRSTDGGVSFAQRSVAFLPGQADVTFNKQDAANGGNIPGTAFWMAGSAQPWVLADPVRPHTVYVIANTDPDQTHGSGDDADVVLAKSTDDGQTWARSTVAAGPSNVPGFINNSFQVFPTAAIDPFGDLVVSWYDNRRGQTNAAGDYLLDVFATYSTDGGTTWAPDFMVNGSTNPFDPDAGAVNRFDGPPPTTRIGEYFGIQEFAGTAYVDWNGNTRDNSGAPTGQQVLFNAFPINGALTITGDDGGAAVDDHFTLRPLAGNPGFIEVLDTVGGTTRREYAGLLSALSGGITFKGLGGNDTLTIDESTGNPIPSGGVSFDGGAGSNTLVITNPVNTWNITGHNSGQVNGTISFSNVQNLTGTTSRDRFVFSNGAGVDGQVTGGTGGIDTLDYTAYTTPITVNLATLTATGTGGFSNIHDVVGGSALDTLIGANTANTWHVTATNAGDVNGVFTFASIENLTGGANKDVFQLSDNVRVSGSIDGGGGNNTLDDSASTGPHPVSLTLQTLRSGTASNLGGTFQNIQTAVGGAGVDNLTGPNADSTWNVSADSPGHVVGSVGTGGVAFNFTSFEHLTGGSSTDTFTVRVTSQSSLSLAVDGGPGSDVLSVLDVEGGAVIHDHKSGPASGTVQVCYLVGATSVITYQSVETVTTNPSADQSFVQDLYHQFLKRNGSPAEINGWVAALQGPGGRTLVANGIIRSQEARTLLVQSWYVQYLKRPAGGGEEQGWVNLLLAGFTEETVLASFLNSPEYYQRAGLQDGPFLQNLYQDGLGRPAGGNEVALWLGSLQSTSGRSGTAWLVFNSVEYRARLVQADYQNLLMRAGSAAELAGWVLSGLDATTLAVLFASSQEFFDNGC